MTANILALAVASTAVFWLVAKQTAERRGVAIGSAYGWLSACVLADAALTAAARAPAPETVALAGLAVAGIVDIRSGLVFDPLVATAFLATAVAAMHDRTLLCGVAGAAAASGGLGSLWLITRGHGIGLGDVKLGAVLGLGLGAAAALTALGFAFVLGAVYGLALLGSRRATRTTAVPFAPFIAGGSFLVAGLPDVGFR